MTTLLRHVVDAGFSAAAEPESLATCRIRLLDYLAALVLGQPSETKRIFTSLADALGGPPQSTIHIGGGRTTVLHAAAANAAIAHASESDDIHIDVTGFHPGATVIPAVLALAEARGIHGADVSRGICAGYEIGGRIGASITPSHRLRGFHATGTIGALAAAAGAAVTVGLDDAQVVSAIGLATSLAGGTFAVLADGIDGKHLHAAHAAMAGVYCCLLVERGMRGSAAALEAKGGFLQAFGDAFDEERLLTPRHGKREIDRVAIKMFPCCAHAFGAVELAIATSQQIDPASITEIRIETYHAAAVLRDPHPRTPNAAKFSIPCCVAAALLDGDLTETSFTEDSLERPLVGALASRMTMAESAEANHAFPARRLVRMSIARGDGRRVQAESWNPRGFGDRSLTIVDLQKKFRSAATPVLGAAAATEIEAHVDALDDCPDWAGRIVRLMASHDRQDAPGRASASMPGR